MAFFWFLGSGFLVGMGCMFGVFLLVELVQLIVVFRLEEQDKCWVLVCTV